MFRRKDLGPREDSNQKVHNDIKKGITGHFAKTLKILQQRHLQLDNGAEIIYSNDASNNLCNVLEAVFLHGLKDSVAQKLTAYVGLSATTLESAYGLNFWNVAAKFTHNDVIVQLQAFSQINTQIGWCRAWVRTALNDGLMQSYLHSMIVDTKTLKYFYHSYAYLRDFEQPGILKNLLTGLMSLEFKLSCNSSVLNLWNNATLQMAGLVDIQHAPSPTISVANTQAGTPNLKMITTDSIQSGGQYSKDSSLSAGQPNRYFTQSVDQPEISCNDSAADFDRFDDAQSMRPFSRTLNSHVPGDSYLSISEGSTCSHISCPDPGVVNSSASPVPWLALATGGASDLMKKTNHDPNESNGRYKKTESSRDLNILEDTVNISRNITRDELHHMNESKESSRMNTKEEADKPQDLANAPHTHTHTSVLHPHHHHNAQRASPEPRHQTRVRNYEEICATLPLVKLDPDEQEEILQKVLHEFDSQAEKERNLNAGQPSQLVKTEQRSSSIMSWVSEDISTHLKSNQNRAGAEEAPAEASAMSCVPSCGQPVQNADVTPDTDNSAARTQERPEALQHSHDAHDEHEVRDELSTSGRYGNSLSGMSGWSSEIEPKKKVEFTKSTDSIKSRGESFASLLRRYTPEQSNKVVTLDQVIGTLSPTAEEQGQDNENISSRSNSSQIELQDSCLVDFEVLPPTDSIVSGSSGVNTSRMLFLFQVAREQGLSHQNFTCRGCLRPIGLIYGQPQLCEFDGGLYCFECHENYETYIPSSIIFNWDFRKKKVCKENFQFLQDYEDQPLYDLELLNPKLYTQLPELMELKTLRQQLCFLKSYLFTCSQKMAETLRQKVWPREHLYDRQDVYSITDLLQVQSNTLHKLMKELVKFASSHVYECLLCSQKGFVCEICRNPKVIFPFEVETTIRCKQCKAVYHKTCMTDSLPCPKCERWGRRPSKSSITEEHPEDYGMSPAS